jgi:undecaprenyl-diphosphatase
MIRKGGHFALGGVTALMALTFLGLAFLAHRVSYFPIDLAITRGVQGMHAGWLDLPLRILNAAGYKPVVGMIDGAIVLLLFVRGARWEAAVASISALAAAATNYLFKWLVGRPRPPSDLVHVEHHLSISNSSFPAGHVLSATMFFGFLCYLTCTRLPPSWRRTALIALLVAIIGLMGLARIKSGEHWPSDVLGGYLIGGPLLVATIAIYQWGRRKKSNPSVRSGWPRMRPDPRPA